MPRLRRKTPHDPVRAIPASAERGLGARRRATAPPAPPAPTTLRDIAIALNGGAPRPKHNELELPAFEELAPPLPVAPLRERVQMREGRAELLVFSVARELFAIELRAVEEAVEGVEAQTIPDAPPPMLGIFALRDRTLPMYSLARVLALPEREVAAMTLVLRPSASRIALAVDAVDDVLDASLGGVRPAPAPENDGLVLGVVWRGHELITLLDADLLVSACLADTPPNSL
jgi:purine-binding chemotaxis protein CheW